MLERAHILLLPTDGSLKLVLVDPSPEFGLLTFIVFPAWWPAAGISAFLLSWSDESPPFVQVAFPDSTLQDFLPEASPEDDMPVEVYTNAEAPPQHADAPFRPHNGASVLIRPISSGEPDVFHAQQTINDSGNAFVPGSNFPHGSDGPDLQAFTLLLGYGYEQFLVRNTDRGWRHDLLEAYQTDVSEAVLFQPGRPSSMLHFKGLL